MAGAKAVLSVVDSSASCHSPQSLVQEAKLPVEIQVRSGANFLEQPVLTTGGQKLSDTTAVLRWLAESWQLEEWYPGDPLRRARVDMFLQWSQAELLPAVSSALENRDGSLQQKNDSRARVEAKLTVLESELRGGKFVVGGSLPTIADLSIRPLLGLLRCIAFEYSPAIQSYLHKFDSIVSAYKSISAQQNVLINQCASRSVFASWNMKAQKQVLPWKTRSTNEKDEHKHQAEHKQDHKQDHKQQDHKQDHKKDHKKEEKTVVDTPQPFQHGHYHYKTCPNDTEARYTIKDCGCHDKIAGHSKFLLDKSKLSTGRTVEHKSDGKKHARESNQVQEPAKKFRSSPKEKSGRPIDQLAEGQQEVLESCDELEHRLWQLLAHRQDKINQNLEALSQLFRGLGGDNSSLLSSPEPESKKRALGEEKPDSGKRRKEAPTATAPKTVQKGEKLDSQFDAVAEKKGQKQKAEKADVSQAEKKAQPQKTEGQKQKPEKVEAPPAAKKVQTRAPSEKKEVPEVPVAKKVPEKFETPNELKYNEYQPDRFDSNQITHLMKLTLPELARQASTSKFVGLPLKILGHCRLPPRYWIKIAFCLPNGSPLIAHMLVTRPEPNDGKLTLVAITEDGDLPGVPKNLLTKQ